MSAPAAPPNGDGALPGAPRGYRAAVRHRVAAPLLAAQLISELGDFVGLAALVVLAYTSSRSPMGPALVLASRSVPALTVAGVLGRWLDRPPRRVALVASHLAGALAVGICAAAPGTLTAVVTTTLLGATRAAFRSVQAAVIAESVEPPLRLPVFGVAALINQCCQTLGILAGATGTLLLGARTALLADIVSFLVAAAILARLPAAPRVVRPPTPGAFGGVRLIYRQPVLRLLALVVLASALSGLVPEALAPAVAHRPWIPVAMAASPLGGALFALVVGRTQVLRRVGNQLRVAAGLALALLLTGMSTLWHGPDWLYATGNAVIGAGLGWFFGAQATFAALTPAHRMAEVEATIVAALIAVDGGGVLLLGTVAKGLSPAAAYLIGGGLLTAVLVGCAARLRAAEREPVLPPAAQPAG